MPISYETDTARTRYEVSAVQQYDFCFAWNWQYDSEFARMLEAACRSEGISLLQVTPHDLPQILHALIQGQIKFRSLLDRASDTDLDFSPLILWARQQNVLRLNRFRVARRAWDKAAMHKRILAAELDAPYTLALPPCAEEPEPEALDLSVFGEKIALKPAHGGGGMGVVIAPACWEQVLAARQAYPFDQYLLQAYVTPTTLDGRPAWFRVIYCAGQVFSCWWDPLTHRYAAVTDEESSRFGLHQLFQISQIIADIAQLELFSSEIAMAQDGRFLVVDYLNDPIDLRLQSQATEGVPDVIVEAVARRLARFVASYLEDPQAYAW